MSTELTGMRRDRRIGMMFRVIGLMAIGVGSCLAETDCYRSMPEAMAGIGVRDNGGYRVDGVTQDVFGGASWARVMNCRHPEWPPVMVKMGLRRPGSAAVVLAGVRAFDESERRMDAPVLMAAGVRVRVVEVDSMVRLETSGVTQEPARMGDRVRVKLLSASGDGQERFVAGVVVAAGLVEVLR